MDIIKRFNQIEIDVVNSFDALSYFSSRIKINKEYLIDFNNDFNSLINIYKITFKKNMGYMTKHFIGYNLFFVIETEEYYFLYFRNIEIIHKLHDGHIAEREKRILKDQDLIDDFVRLSDLFLNDYSLNKVHEIFFDLIKEFLKGKKYEYN